MDGLRKGAQSINNKSTNKGGSKRSAFYTRLKIPQMKDDLKPYLAAPPHEESKLEVSEPIVIIPGKYEDNYATDRVGNRIVPAPLTEGYRFKAHTFSIFVKPKNPSQKGFQTFRDITCSAGPEPHAPQPCLGCYQVDHGAKDSKPKDQWAFNIAHLGW